MFGLLDALVVVSIFIASFCHGTCDYGGRADDERDGQVVFPGLPYKLITKNKVLHVEQIWWYNRAPNECARAALLVWEPECRRESVSCQPANKQTSKETRALETERSPYIHHHCVRSLLFLGKIESLLRE